MTGDSRKPVSGRPARTLPALYPILDIDLCAHRGLDTGLPFHEILDEFRLVAGEDSQHVVHDQHLTGGVLAGTDADDHGGVSGGVNQDGWFFMQRALENLAPGVTNGNKVVTILGSTSTAASAITSAFNLSNLGAAANACRRTCGLTWSGAIPAKAAISRTISRMSFGSWAIQRAPARSMPWRIAIYCVAAAPASAAVPTDSPR